MASLQADIPTPVKEVTEETTHDDDQESAAVDQDQDLARKDIEFIAIAEETDHKPKEVVLPDDIEEDSEVVADDHEVDKAAVSPIEEDSKWTEKIEHEAEDQDDEDDELE